MADKDKIEKTLEAYNDVFADIVNVLLFNGNTKVKEEDLEDESPISIFKADGKIHSQERDVAKFWKNSNVRIALYGFENQTKKDRDMPFRIIAYDGASYKRQLIDDKKTSKNKSKKVHYPVITLVLYFGEQHWKKPRSLVEALNIDDDLKPFVSDYKINIFEIAYLSDEQLNMFTSDFKIVADYFVQKRKNKNYIPSKQVIKHVEEVMELMRVLTGDKDYEITEKLIYMKGEPITMDTWLHDTLEKERIDAKNKGKIEGKLEALYSLMKKGVLSLQQVAVEMGLSIAKLKKELDKHSMDYSEFI